jgi:hypothetical protein
MTSKKKNKKKSSRKAKANAVSSKRRSPRPTNKRLRGRPHVGGSSPVAKRVARPADFPNADESAATDNAGVAGEAEAVPWGAFDPEALWWDDVWPFKDETSSPEAPDTHLAVPAKTPEEPEESVEPKLEGGGRREPEPVPAAPPSAARSATEMEGSASTPSRKRSRRRGWIAALPAAAMVLAGLAWLVAGRNSEVPDLTLSNNFAPPTHLRPDTSFVRSRVLPSGDLEVTHWIHSRAWMYAVTLDMPQVAGLSPRSVSATKVTLASNGLRTIKFASIGIALGKRTFQLPPTHSLYIRYRLSGVVERSLGTSDRALARITSLDVGTATRLVNTTRTVVGARVLNLACTPDRSTGLTTPCGTEHGGNWIVRLKGAEETNQVMAQLDMS